MAYQVEWTKRAQTTFNQTVEYLQNEFGDKSAEKFIQKVDDYVDLIVKNPQFGKIVEDEKSSGDYWYQITPLYFTELRVIKLLFSNFLMEGKTLKKD
ncbi:MAG: type II toxin-antitoxin system RelE/ParE family toxin [Chitinophagales bacterium]